MSWAEREQGRGPMLRPRGGGERGSPVDAARSRAGGGRQRRGHDGGRQRSSARRRGEERR
jgi:hypothetical protein